jgi:general secretion pathway protein D
MKIKIILLNLAIFLSITSICWGQQELTIKEYLEQALPPQEGRKIVVNEAMGLLTITDTPTNHKLIKKLLKQIDVGPKQVLIEARFVEVSVSNLNELGIEWSWYRAGGTKGSSVQDLSVGNAPGYSDPNAKTTADGIYWGESTLRRGTFTEPFPQTEQGLDLFISKTTYSGSYLRAYLHALEEEGKANLLSSPKVTTLSGQMANIQVTDTFPYISELKLENIGTAEFPIWKFKYTTDERTVGISLEVTPYVGTDSKYITLDINPTVDVLLSQVPIHYTIPTDVGWPVVETRSTQTSVVIKSGETIVMGGLIRDEEKTFNKKIPLLGDIPLLGNLFRYKYSKRDKKNLLIFLTATLINSEGEEVK